MITKEQARDLVAAEIGIGLDWLAQDDKILILDPQTIEKSWGWVFFYTSKKWYETQDIEYAIAGTAPINVKRNTGKLIPIGTAMATEKYIENYERSGNLNG